MLIQPTNPVADVGNLEQPIALRLPGWAFGLKFGTSSNSVEQKLNEDFWGIAKVDPALANRRGIAVAIADGVSGDGGGRIAAEAAIRSIVEDYYSTSESWSNTRALDKVLCSVNDWLLAENVRQREQEGKVCALTALLFEQHGLRVAHVGDTRAYRLRDSRLEQLTTDHIWPRHDMRHVLKRAVGLDTHLIVDYTAADVQINDIVLLLSDGVWEVLGETSLRQMLIERGDAPQLLADQLAIAAREHQSKYMGRNDATAVVVQITAP